METDLTARLIELEDLILQLDSTFADLEAAAHKGYLLRDLPRLRAEADRIREKRRDTRLPAAPTGGTR